MQGGPVNNPERWLLVRSCALSYSSFPLCPIETTLLRHLSLSLLLRFIPAPRLYHLSPHPLWQSWWRGVYWSAEFHLTCLPLRLKDKGPLTSALTAHCRPPEKKLRRIQCSCPSIQSTILFLLLIASLIYCLPLPSFCSVLLHPTCVMFTNCCHPPPHCCAHLSLCKKGWKKAATCSYCCCCCCFFYHTCLVFGISDVWAFTTVLKPIWVMIIINNKFCSC